MKRDGLLHSFWSMDGKIFVKTSPQGTLQRSSVNMISITCNYINSYSILNIYFVSINLLISTANKLVLIRKINGVVQGIFGLIF